MVSSVVDGARAEFPELEVRERSLAEYPELGPLYGVTATPAIVVNGRLEFRNIPSRQAFRARLIAIMRTDGH